MRKYVGEHLEFVGAAHVVAVAGDAVGDQPLGALGAHLALDEGLDHAVLLGHAANPLVRFDAHGGGPGWLERGAHLTGQRPADESGPPDGPAPPARRTPAGRTNAPLVGVSCAYRSRRRVDDALPIHRCNARWIGEARSTLRAIQLADSPDATRAPWRRVDDALPIHRCNARWIGEARSTLRAIQLADSPDATRAPWRRVDDALPIHRCNARWIGEARSTLRATRF